MPNHYTHRRQRRRLSKKTSNTNSINQVSSSIQQTQIAQNFSSPIFRQPNHKMAQELSIKKQQILSSPRAHSSRITHLPDILNQSLPIEPSLNENYNGKYTLQREKPLTRLPKPIIDIPIASSIYISSEETHNGIARSSPTQDSHSQTQEFELGESSNGILIHGSPSISTTSINRQRPSLRTISLRQQFITPFKLKTTGISSTTNNNQNQPINNSLLSTRRSTSLKQTTPRIHDDNDDLNSNNGILSTLENRPMTSTRSIKQLKRSDVIHFNSKNLVNDSNRSNLPEPTPERFQNLLTIVRPPYATGNGTSSNLSSVTQNDSTVQATNHNHTNGNFRSARSTSARGSFGFHMTSNTVIV
jgi:hypothetical protein